MLNQINDSLKQHNYPNPKVQVVVGTLSTGKTAVVLKPQRHRTEVYIYMHARTQSSSLNQAHHIACWNSTISGTLNQHDIQQQQDVAGERRTPGLSYLASCT
jgi:hypothetical protein